MLKLSLVLSLLLLAAVGVFGAKSPLSTSFTVYLDRSDFIVKTGRTPASQLTAEGV